MAKSLDELRDYYDSADTSEALERAELVQPDPTVEPMVTYALRLPKPVIDQLRRVAEDRGVRVTTLMRTWLEERLARDPSADDRVIDVDELLALVAERSRPVGRADAA